MSSWVGNRDGRPPYVTYCVSAGWDRKSPLIKEFCVFPIRQRWWKQKSPPSSNPNREHVSWGRRRGPRPLFLPLERKNQRIWMLSVLGRNGRESIYNLSWAIIIMKQINHSTHQDFFKKENDVLRSVVAYIFNSYCLQFFTPQNHLFHALICPSREQAASELAANFTLKNAPELPSRSMNPGTNRIGNYFLSRWLVVAPTL